LNLHESEGVLGLIIEYVEGIDLIRAEKILRDRGAQMPLDSAVVLISKVLDGLDFAHKVRDDEGDLLHVVHRDMSPGNIMLDVDGHVRIVDWGIARAKNRIAQTEAGHVKGKFRYMAPEQIGAEAVGPYTDVYSTAVTFWELLAGRRVYDTVELPQLMMMVSRAEVPTLDDARTGLPKGLHAVYKKATARNPVKRFQSAEAFADALDELGLVPDVVRATKRLQAMSIAARVADGRLGFEKAVREVKVAASEGGLEGALLRALEEPDRVERVELGSVLLLRAESGRSALSPE